MKTAARITLAIAIVAMTTMAVVASAQSVQKSPLVEMPPAKAAARSGACAFPIGGWVIVNCSNVAAASSAQLNAWSRYVVQCLDDSYIAWGDEVGDAADTSDGYLPSGAWLEFMTTDSVRYVSCLNINADKDCRLVECL